MLNARSERGGNRVLVPRWRQVSILVERGQHRLIGVSKPRPATRREEEDYCGKTGVGDDEIVIREDSSDVVDYGQHSVTQYTTQGTGR